MNDEFYIGWQSQAPMRTGRTVRRASAALLASAFVVAALAAFSQRTIGTAIFEWGNVKEFSGIMRSEPVPHLLVPQPAQPGAFTNFYLVNPFKFGFNAELAQELEGQAVTLRGTLIHRGEQRMIEVARNSVRAAPGKLRLEEPVRRMSFGERTFIGEIVDSKCWLGVMNPGALKPHRACAVRCISGGVPPILIVRQQDGTALHLLLVGRDGQPINQEVLSLVAEPVEITGELIRHGDLWALRAAPATFRRR